MKKRIYLLISGLGLSLALITAGCATGPQYDITGTWNALVNGSIAYTMTFSGDKESGTITDTYPTGSGTGTYTVSEDLMVTITATYPWGETITYTGTMTSESYMAGTWTSTWGSNGSWTMTR